MGLFSKNIHGTKKSTVAAVVQVDLRVAPVAPSSVSITGGKAKKTIAGSTVYLPNGTDDITFSWKVSTNPLNAPFSYHLYEVYNGEETRIATVDSNSTSYSYVRPPQLNDIASLAFKVVAITSYGYSSEKTSNQIRLEYYNPPTISVGEISRKDTSASVNVLIKINTSIPSVQGTGTWECSNNQKGNITTSSNIKITNLKSDNTYSLIILYNDNSDLSISRRESISIGKNLPIVDINIYGLGVGGYVANTTNALNVKGNAMIDGLLSDSTGRVYTTGNKPTPADIGALPLSGGTLTGDLVINNNNKRLKIIGANTNLEIGAGDNDVFIHNTTSGSYLQFNNNGNLYINSLLIGTQTYPIIGSDTNWWFQRIAPVMSDGVMEVGKYIDFHKASSDSADYTVRLDATGSSLWCSTSIQQGSDRELKENIKYLDDEPMLLSVKEGSSTPFKDFIKDFKFATYNYKGSKGRCFGFIAQDIAKNPVGRLLTQEHEMDIINKKTREIEGTETTLAFNLADYTSVVAKALQEEIREKDEKIIELESRLEKLENMIKDYESSIKSDKRK